MRTFLFLGVAAAVNPVQKVVSMLQNMSAKVTSLGETAQKEYGEYSQWCRDNSKDLNFSLETSSDRLAEQEAVIFKAKSDIQTATTKISELSGASSDAEKELAEGKKLRAAQKSDFTNTEKELEETVSALTRAHGILGRETGKSLAQMPQLKRVLIGLDSIISASDVSRQITSLVQDDTLSSGSIMDTIADMLDKAEAQLQAARKKEMESKFNHEMEAQSLDNMLKCQGKEMDENKKVKATAEETLAAAQGSVAELKKAKSQDEQALHQLHHECMERATEFEQDVKERQGELSALAKAREIIQKTTGGATSRQYAESFLQTRQVDGRVARLLKKAGLAMLAEQVQATVAQGGDFSSVKGMISDMIAKLSADAEKEASQKAFCDDEMKKANEKKDGVSETVDELSTRKSSTESQIEKLKEDVATAQSELGSLLKSQAEMDKMRQEASKLNADSATDYSQGLEGLQGALKVLRDYYAQGDDESLIQTTKQTDSANGIINMLEVAESDFSKSLAEVRAAEEEQAKAYADQTNENKVRTATLQTEVTQKNAAIQTAENTLSEASGDYDTAASELDAVHESLSKLTEQCVAKPEPYEERKARRESEIAGLKEALGVLSEETGSSFMATRVITRHA